MKRHGNGLPNWPFAVLACLLWSTAFVGIKKGYEQGATPLFFAGVRFFLSGVVLIPLSAVFEGSRALRSAFVHHGGFLFIVGFFRTFLLYGAILGWTLMPGDVPDPGSITGMVLIAGSILAYFKISRV